MMDCPFIGGSYKKYIELFNHCYEAALSGEISAMFFLTALITILKLTFPMEDKQKGPSKENRHDPDHRPGTAPGCRSGAGCYADVSLVMSLRKPYIRKVIRRNERAVIKFPGKPCRSLIKASTVPGIFMLP